MDYRFGIIGSGSWATALVKILTDNNQKVNWWIRNSPIIEQIKKRRHNPHYLSSAYFDVSLLSMSDDINKIIDESDILVLAVPSAYIKQVLTNVPASTLQNKKILSAIKGLVPQQDLLLNEFLLNEFNFPIENIYCRERKKQSHREKEQYEKQDSAEDFFKVEENGLEFLVNLTDYLDTGLFLDHRITRGMVRKEFAHKRVLNLFAYTGSFSVYAASGNAAEVTTVDLSKTYLEWAKIILS